MRSLCSICDGIGWLCRDAEGALHKYDAPGVTGTAVPCKCQQLNQEAKAEIREAKKHPRAARKSKKHLPAAPTIPDRKSLAAGE